MSESDLQRYIDLVDKFSQVKVGVIGDIVADRFVYGVPERLSREAPVPIIIYESEELFPGCAGNTIRNLQDLGAFVHPVSALGDDPWAEEVLDYFDGSKVQVDKVFKIPEEETITKTRILAGDFHTKKQQVVRIDRGKKIALNRLHRQRMMDAIEELTKEVQAWIVSDYGHNIIDETIIEFMAQIGEKKPVIVDSRARTTHFSGIALATPNEGEAEGATGIEIQQEGQIEKVGQKLLEATEGEAILVTRGNQGMCLFERGKEMVKIPCYGGSDIADVTGAGDTVTSIATLALAAGGSYLDAARLATYGAFVVVMKMGTATCSKGELASVLRQAYQEGRAI